MWIKETTAKYDVQAHPHLGKRDFLELPQTLRDNYGNILSVLAYEPFEHPRAKVYPLSERLLGCHAMEIKQRGSVTYHILIYRVEEQPSPTVQILSFAENQLAKDRAIERLVDEEIQLVLASQNATPSHKVRDMIARTLVGTFVVSFSLCLIAVFVGNFLLGQPMSELIQFMLPLLAGTLTPVLAFYFSNKTGSRPQLPRK